MKLSAIKETLLPAVAANNTAAMLAAIETLRGRPDASIAWQQNFTKLETFIKTGIPQWSIVAKNGNSKLPFMSFSALPGAGFCPGAGDCLEFCYSFTGWRHVGPLFRQIQNTLLLNSASGRRHILAAVRQVLAGRKYQAAIQSGKKIDFRLYVDGDFRHLADMAFWFDFLATDDGQKLAVYGYSKSFQVFRRYARSGRTWPNNYLLNISSGHKYGPAIVADIESLPITRGHFKTIPMNYRINSDMHGDRAHQKRLRAAYGNRAFTCPGQCGECTIAGHACGAERFRGIDIIIAVH